MEATSRPCTPELISPILDSKKYALRLEEGPVEGRTLSGGLKKRDGRWLVEPIPILRLVRLNADPTDSLYLNQPGWFCFAQLESVDKTNTNQDAQLSGTLSVSITKVRAKRSDERAEEENGYFVFKDLSIKDLGRWKIRFYLYETCFHTGESYVQLTDSVISAEIKIHSGSSRDVLRVSSELCKTLNDVGHKIKIRKESRKRRNEPLSWSARPQDSFDVSSTQLAPILTRSGMGPPATTRMDRHLGEDIAHRIRVETTPNATVSNASTRSSSSDQSFFPQEGHVAKKLRSSSYPQNSNANYPPGMEMHAPMPYPSNSSYPPQQSYPPTGYPQDSSFSSFSMYSQNSMYNVPQMAQGTLPSSNRQPEYQPYGQPFQSQSPQTYTTPPIQEYHWPRQNQEPLPMLQQQTLPIHGLYPNTENQHPYNNHAPYQ